MIDDNLTRYSRQIMLSECDIDGQEKLLTSAVLIIGLGGLGSPVALYLAAAGIGKLTLVDPDHVDLSNLQRQIIHTTIDINKDKVASAAESIKNINPNCEVITINKALGDDKLEQQIKAANLVLDCTDNFTIRFLINRLCKQNKIPLVSGAAIRWEGQVSVFSGQTEDACYQCLYPEQGNEDESCTNNGVIAPLVGIIGSMQALEAIKILTQAGTTLKNKLLIFDALHSQWRSLKVRQDTQCPVCHGNKTST